jgi:hypothetical protein
MTPRCSGVCVCSVAAWLVHKCTLHAQCADAQNVRLLVWKMGLCLPL